MASRRIWLALATTLVLANAATAQDHSLIEKPGAGDCYRLTLSMKLNGRMQVTREEKEVALKLSASASHELVERILNVQAGLPNKSVRVYDKAEAVITVDRERSERTLRPERRLQVAQRHQDQGLFYSPSGPLTREELELTGEHFDTLYLTGLLPHKSVPVGESWKVPDKVVQALCHFEGLTSQNVTCKLAEVKDDVARISIGGTVSGIDLGALVKLTITAEARFAVKLGRLIALEWSQRDERDQGPASPASVVQTETRLTREPIEQPASLSDAAIVPVPDGFEPPLPMLLLSYTDPKQRYEFSCGREWQITSRSDNQVVMRCMDRGDFIAQAALTWWKPAKPGEHLTAEQFQRDMIEAPGWQAEQVVQTGEVPLDGGRWCYRVSALGEQDGLKVMQNFYLIAGPQGEQVVLAFTFKPDAADKLATRDLSIVSSLEFPASRKEPDKKP